MGDAGKYPFKLWSDDIYDGKSADAEDQKSCQADSSLDLKKHVRIIPPADLE